MPTAEEKELEKIENEIAEIKLAMLQMGLRKEEIIRNSQLELFVPNTKQAEFIEHSLWKRRAGFCGNRFGKSTIGVVEDCCWLLGERPFFPVGHPLRRAGIPARGVKGLVIAEDWEKVREIFTEDKNVDQLGKFFHFLPEDKVKSVTRNHQGVIESIIVENEIDGRIRTSSIKFETVASYKTSPRSMESSDWDFIHLDEPIPQAMWIAVSRGLIDRGGHSWWLMTAMTEPWMYNEFIENCALFPDIYWMFEASMDDNPLLSEQDKQLFLSQLTPEEYECRRKGKPLAHGRLVYGRFDSKRHIWQKPTPPEGWLNWHTPPREYYCSYAIDPHAQTPHAILFSAVSPFGDVFLYDEIFERSLISEMGEKVKARVARARFGYGLCDPCAWVKNPDTGRRWVDTLYKLGLNVQQGSKDLGPGIIQVNDLLGSARNVWVFPHLRVFLKEIKTWFFDKENKPVDKDDHMMENFRRLVQHDGFTWRKEIIISESFKVEDEFTKQADTSLKEFSETNINIKKAEIDAINNDIQW